MDLSRFSHLKEVWGRIEVSETQLTNMTFMGNLEGIIGDNFLSHGILSIHDNPNLKFLGWNSLKKLTPIDQEFELIITNNHPEFCLSTQEAQIFAEVFVVFSNKDKILLCPDLTRTDGIKVCTIENLEENCHHVVGDVMIDENNEMDVLKFQNVTHIYGSLVIRDTKELVDLSFLSNLRNVIRLTKDDDQIIRILSNKKLAIVEFPSMKVPPFPYSPDVHFLEIRDNSQEIFKVQRDCLLVQAKTKTPIKYNGLGCSKLPGKQRSSNGAILDYYDEDSSNIHFRFTFILLFCDSKWVKYFSFTGPAKKPLRPSYLPYRLADRETWELTYLMVDGFIAIFISMCYILVAIALVIGIRRANKIRKNVSKEEQSRTNTSALVLSMAFSLFVSEAVYATLFYASYIYFGYMEQEEFKKLDSFVLTLQIVNSCIHCLICFCMSSQYRDTVKGLFGKRREDKSIVSIVRSSSG
ncbi:unnamed protein product [Caenorhabditis nigoni]